MGKNTRSCELKQEVLSFLIDDINKANNFLETIEKDLHTVDTQQKK
jgi:hypothetical protein